MQNVFSLIIFKFVCRRSLEELTDNEIFFKFYLDSAVQCCLLILFFFISSLFFLNFKTQISDYICLLMAGPIAFDAIHIFLLKI